MTSCSRGLVLLQNSTFSINIDHNTLGLQPKVKATKERSYDGMLEPPVRQKFAKIRETLQRAAPDHGRRLCGRLPRLQRGRRLSLGNFAAASPR